MGLWIKSIVFCTPHASVRLLSSAHQGLISTYFEPYLPLPASLRHNIQAAYVAYMYSGPSTKVAAWLALLDDYKRVVCPVYRLYPYRRQIFFVSLTRHAIDNLAFVSINGFVASSTNRIGGRPRHKGKDARWRKQTTQMAPTRPALWTSGEWSFGC